MTRGYIEDKSREDIRSNKVTRGYTKDDSREDI